MILRKITYVLTMITMIVGMASMTVCVLDGFGVTHVGIRAILGL